MKNQETTGHEFDSFAKSYRDAMEASLKGSGYDTFYDEYKIRELHDFLANAKYGKDDFSFLNFGCGIGKSEPFIRKYFSKAKIYSIDVSVESINVAKDNNNFLHNLEFAVFDGVDIPFDLSFDVIFIANVLHHIPYEQHMTIMDSIYNRLNKDGYLFIFEHNPHNPITRRIVNSCVFDKNAVLLKPKYCLSLLKQYNYSWFTIRYTLFFPKSLSLLRLVEKYLRKLPLGAQYYCICMK